MLFWKKHLGRWTLLTWDANFISSITNLPCCTSRYVLAGYDTWLLLYDSPHFSFFVLHLLTPAKPHYHFDSGTMNSFHLARNLSRRSQTIVSSRFFSKGGAIPTSSTAEVGGVKVVGLPHLSVRWSCASQPHVELSISPLLPSWYDFDHNSRLKDVFYEVGWTQKELAQQSGDVPPHWHIGWGRGVCFRIHHLLSHHRTRCPNQPHQKVNVTFNIVMTLYQHHSRLG